MTMQLLADGTIIAGGVSVNVSDISKMLNGPIFRANKTSAQQVVTAGQNIRIDFNNEDVDSSNAYNVTTNRFTPQVQGWYSVNLRKYINNGATAQTVSLDLNKNGARVIRMGYGFVAVSSGVLFHGSSMVYFNGTTDYIEASVLATSATLTLDPDTTLDEFSAFYLRP